MPGSNYNETNAQPVTELDLATESEAGIAEIATQVEVDAGTDDTRFVTPLKLATGTTGSSAGNSGQVKVNTGNGIKPQFVFVGGGGSNLGVFQQITYAAPLGLSSSPTTTRPANISSPVDADIYDSVNDTFIENTVPGQVHSWRVIVEYSGKSSGADSGIAVKIENTLSGFTEETIVFAPSSTTSGKIGVLLATIADSASLPSPFGTGQGYEISVTAFDPMTIDVDSVSRISLAFG